MLAALFLVLGGQGVWAAFNAPQLAVQRIVVAGSQTLQPEQVAAMTGIGLGTNIFRANLYRARKTIQSVPAIREANVARLLPSTIAITLVERRPALVLASSGRLFEVDGEGVIFREISPFAPPSAGLPLLSPQPGVPARLGERLDRSVVEAALHCVRLARAKGLLLSKMSIDAHGDLWLNVKVAGERSQPSSSLPIRIGRPQELSAKISDTSDLLQHAPQLAQVAQYLDVSCPRRPAYRLAAEQSANPVAPRQ
jgi:hypothetical protein